MTAPTTVDAYLADLPPDRRAAFEELRRTIIAAAPEASESIAYGMPALRSRDGEFVVSYAAFKEHYSLFPASGEVMARLGDELAPYVTGRATIRFRAGAPIPLGLVSRVVAIRVEERATPDRH